MNTLHETLTAIVKVTLLCAFGGAALGLVFGTGGALMGGFYGLLIGVALSALAIRADLMRP